MAAAAGGGLASLDAAQLAPARRPRPEARPPPGAERQRWHYTPTDHGGLTLGRQRPAQQALAMRLVATGLSDAGYVTACAVMGLENVLDRDEGFPSGTTERLRDPGRYYLRVFGDP